VVADVIEELERRGLFTKRGEWRPDPRPFTQSIEDYLQSLHSGSALSQERMPAADLSAFDDALRELLRGHARNGQLELMMRCWAVWGTPGDTAASAER
jgi:hypothetical protein